jgi:hypothetical protein
MLELKTNFDFQDVVAQLQESTDVILCVRDNEYLSIFKDIESLPQHLAFKTTHKAERGHVEYYFYCPSHGSEYVFFREDAKKWLTKNYRESLTCETKNKAQFNTDMSDSNISQTDTESLRSSTSLQTLKSLQGFTSLQHSRESRPFISLQPSRPSRSSQPSQSSLSSQYVSNNKTVLHNNRNMSTSSVLSAKREKNSNNILILDRDDRDDRDDSDDETETIKTLNEGDLGLNRKAAKTAKAAKSRTKHDMKRNDDFSTTESIQTLGSIDFNDFNANGLPLVLPDDNSCESDDNDSSDLEETIAIPN